MGEMFQLRYRRDSVLKSAIYPLIPEVLFRMGRTANATSKTTVAVVCPLDYIRKQQVASIEKLDCGICAVAFGGSIQGESEIEKWKGQHCVWKCSLALFIRQRSCRLKLKTKAILAEIIVVVVF